MYLLTEWEGRTEKYLGRGHGVRTERSEVRAPCPSAKYFPVRPDLTQSISILLYDHCAFPFSIFFFRVTKFGMSLILTEKSDLYNNKVVLVLILPELLIKSPYEGRTRS